MSWLGVAHCVCVCGGGCVWLLPSSCGGRINNSIGAAPRLGMCQIKCNCVACIICLPFRVFVCLGLVFFAV